MKNFSPKRKPYQNLPMINERIRADQVRLISETGEMIGLTPTKQAVAMAKDRGYDLVIVSSTSDTPDTPVTKIMDYGKHKFELEKKARDAKKKQHVVALKEIKMRYKIDKHDYQVHVKKAEKFLKHGDKVKVQIPLFGREMEHKELALKLITKFVTDVAEWGTPEKPPRREGKAYLAIFVPIPQPTAKKAKKQSSVKSEDNKIDAPKSE